MDASVAVREPASHKGWRSVRSTLQLILAILVVCAWDASVTSLSGHMEDHQGAKDIRVAAAALAAAASQVVLIAPGMLAARLASRGYPTSVRMCIRTVVAFSSGRRSVTG